MTAEPSSSWWKDLILYLAVAATCIVVAFAAGSLGAWAMGWLLDHALYL